MSVTKIISSSVYAHHYLPFRRNSFPIKKEHIIRAREIPDRRVKKLAREMKNPLNNIDLSVQMLGSGVKDEEFKMCLDIISRSVQRINELLAAGSDFKISL